MTKGGMLVYCLSATTPGRTEALHKVDIGHLLQMNINVLTIFGLSLFMLSILRMSVVPSWFPYFFLQWMPY